MDTKLRKQLKIPASNLAAINDFLLDPKNKLVNDVMKVIAKHGTIDEINRKSREARALPNLMKRLREMKSPYVPDLEWLIEQRDKGAFVSVADYRRKVLGDAADKMKFKKANAVTLEISAFQYFPWIIAQAKQAIEHRELMPGRFIRVRYMKESEADQGDLLAGHGGDANRRRVVRGHARHQRHGRLERPSGRAGHDHRLFRRHRRAE